MVMTAGTSRLRKTEAVEATETDPSKESHDTFDGIKLSSAGGDFEELTNDQGDVFYRPTLTISSKLSTSFEGKSFNETIRNWFRVSGRDQKSGQYVLFTNKNGNKENIYFEA